MQPRSGSLVATFELVPRTEVNTDSLHATRLKATVVVKAGKCGASRVGGGSGNKV